MPFDTANGTRKLQFPLLTFLTLVYMILYVLERSCFARGAESRVLHCGRRARGDWVNEIYWIDKKGNQPTPLSRGGLNKDLTLSE